MINEIIDQLNGLSNATNLRSSEAKIELDEKICRLKLRVANLVEKNISHLEREFENAEESEPITRKEFQDCLASSMNRIVSASNHL